MAHKLLVDSLDKFLEYTQQYGSRTSALANALRGINFMGAKGYLPSNKDYQGFTFFTRPQLNLCRYNIVNNRKLYPFLDTRKDSVFKYVRHMLDPRLAYTMAGGGGYEISEGTELVDPEQAFIPVLTNTLKSISGWPDIAMPNYTSRAGRRQEEWSVTDGPFDIYNANDIDCTFYNVKNEPTILLFLLWEYYQSLVYEGMVTPYIDYIINNEIDYNTRIYRLVLDETKTYIRKISATGASFPVTVPTGQFFDYDDSKVYSDQTKEFTIKFRSMGAEYNDYITMLEFNRTSAIFNSGIRQMLHGRSAPALEKIPKSLLPVFNFWAYPYINLYTTELEWYVNKATCPIYEKIMGSGSAASARVAQASADRAWDSDTAAMNQAEREELEAQRRAAAEEANRKRLEEEERARKEKEAQMLKAADEEKRARQREAADAARKKKLKGQIPDLEQRIYNLTWQRDQLSKKYQTDLKANTADKNAGKINAQQHRDKAKSITDNYTKEFKRITKLKQDYERQLAEAKNA